MTTCAHCGCEFVATHTPDYCDPCCRAAQIRCLKCHTAFLPPKQYPFGWCFDCARADPAHVPFRLPTHPTIGKEERLQQIYREYKEFSVTEEDRERFAAQAKEAEPSQAEQDSQLELRRLQLEERRAADRAERERERQAHEQAERESRNKKRRERRQRRSAIDYLRRLYVKLCRKAIVSGKASEACITARKIYLDAVEERYRLIGKLNDRIWRRIHNLGEALEEPKPHVAPVPEADDWDDEEDWRPLFLRSHGSVRDEQRIEDAARYLEQWLPLWRERFEQLQIRLLEEQDDERSAEPWAPADDEPQERPKITPALLKTFHNDWQEFKR